MDDRDDYLYAAAQLAIEQGRLDRIEQVMDQFLLRSQYVDTHKVAQLIELAHTRNFPKAIVAIMKSSVMLDMHAELLKSMPHADPELIHMLLLIAPSRSNASAAITTAIKHDNPNTIAFFKQKGRDIDVTDCMHQAARAGAHRVVGELIQMGVPLEAGLNAIRQSIVADKTEVTRLLAQALHRDEVVYLFNTVRLKNLALAQALLDGIEPPYHDCQRGLINAFLDNKTDVQDDLFERLAGPETWGEIYLHYANSSNKLPALEQRLKDQETKKILTEQLNLVGSDGQKKKM